MRCTYGVTASVRMQRDDQVPAHARASLRPTLNKLGWILAALLSVVLSVHAQQGDDVQKQIQQLKQQYEQTTRELQERIAALEQQLKKEAANREDPPKRQAVSEVELAVQDAAKVTLRQSKENQSLQVQVPAAPTYDQLRDADTRMEKLEQQVQPQTLLVFLVDPPWLPLPFLVAVPEQLFFLVTHELFVRTAA